MSRLREETAQVTEKIASDLLHTDRYVQICVLARMLGEITGAGEDPNADFSYAEAIMQLAHAHSALRSRGT